MTEGRRPILLLLLLLLAGRLACDVAAAELIMAALCNRGAIIFLPCSFYLLSSIFFFLA